MENAHSENRDEGKTAAIAWLNDSFGSGNTATRHVIETTTLRDQFAMAAVAGLLCNRQSDDWFPRDISDGAYEIADACMVKRAKVQS